MKHPQFILAVRSPMFAHRPNVQFGEGNFYIEAIEPAAVQSHLVVAQREHLDNSSNSPASYKGDLYYRQVLPYTAFVLGDLMGLDTRVAVYRRGGNVGEARLSGNVSIGYGGHIDLDDVVSENSVLNFLETIKQSTARELSEEVKVSVDSEPIIMFQPEFMGWMIDNSNDVGYLHAAYLQVVTLPEAAVVAPLEDELHPLESYTLRELLNSNLPLEVWTRSFALYLAELT